MSCKRKIRFYQFFLIASLTFTAVVVFLTGMYFRAQANKAFYDMINMTENNNFQQCVIGLNEYYTQVANNIKIIQNSNYFNNIIKRYNKLSMVKSKSELSFDEIYEKYNLKKDIKEFIHNIVIQNQTWLLYYGKSATDLLYKDITIFMQNDIISAEGVIDGKYDNIFNIAGEKSSAVRFLSHSQLSELGISIKDQHSCVLFSIMDSETKICDVLILLNNFYIANTIHNSENIIIAKGNDHVIFEGSNMGAVKWQSLNDRHEDGRVKQNAANEKDIVIKTAGLIVDDLSLYYMISISEYDKVKVRQGQYLILAMLMNLILVFIISRYQARRIILPVNEINRLISGFPQQKPDLKENNLNKTGKTFSLHERLTYYFIGTVAFPLVLFMATYYMNTMNEFRRYIDDYSQSIIETEASTISKIIERKANSFLMFINDPDVTKTMENQAVKTENIQAALEQGVFMGIGNSRIMLMDKNKRIVFYNNKTIIDDYKGILKSIDSYEAFLPIKWELDRNLLGEYTLTLWTPVFSGQKDSKMKRIGMAALFVDFREIEYVFFYSMGPAERKIYLKDKEDSLYDVYNRIEIKSDYNTVMEESKANEQNAIRVNKWIEGLDWDVFSIFSRNYIDAKTNSIKRDCVYLLLLIILLSVVYSFIISTRVLRPINRLNYYFNTVELDSVSDIDIDEYFIDEIDKIGKNFIRMLERIEQLIDELMLSQYNNLELYRKEKSAQVMALQAQITPHFLYNTLDTIINLVQNMQIEKAVLMIKSLGDLLRYSVTDNNSTITVEEEIKYAVSYANILTVRYKERVQFIWEVESGIGQYECIQMILQPLLENCVTHAFNQTELKVNIRCEKSGNDIIFNVRDNGRGIGEKELEDLKERIKTEKRYDAHIGLNNVHSRLQLIYGDLYGLNITSSLGEGTDVRVRIPAKEKDRIITG